MSERSVFLLGAGLGTRLRPLTDSVPKVMVEVAPGMPLLEHTIRGLKAQGFRHFVVNLHYLPDVIRGHFRDGAPLGVKIEYSDESAGLCDTAGAIRRAADMLSDSFVLLYGDQLHKFDLRTLAAVHDRLAPAITILVKRSDHPQNGDLARVSPDGRIAQWIPRPHPFQEFEPGLYLNTGTYIIDKTQVLPRITQPVLSLDKSVIPGLAADGVPLAAVVTDAIVLDIGEPQKLEAARQWYEKNREEISRWYGTPTPPADPRAVP
ncbi:MAG: NDP-sugar synthase [Planctomycetales bacterium]